MPDNHSRRQSYSRSLSPYSDRSRRDSPRRSVSHRSESRTHSLSRSLTPRPSERRNGYRRESLSRSLSPHREGLSSNHNRMRSGRWPRDRSNTRSLSPQSPPRRSSKIVVEKLTKNVSENHLHEIFGSFGEIQSIDLPMNRAFMTNRGTAYIVYRNVGDAEIAMSHMHEAQLDGAVLKVSIILRRRDFSRSPPPPRNNREDGPRPRSRTGRDSRIENTRRPSDSFQASPPRRGSPRRYGSSRGPMDRHDTYRPRTQSWSRSPRRSRSYSIRSDSRSPVRRRRDISSPDDHRRRKRRSPSYSSYSSVSSRNDFSDRSRSVSRSRTYRADARR